MRIFLRESYSPVVGLRGMVCLATVLFALFWAASPVHAQSNEEPCSPEQLAPNPDPEKGGSGSLENPFKVGTLCQLQGMRSSLTAHYELVANIIATRTANWNAVVEAGVAKGFEPIALGPVLGGSFRGSFVNSNNYVITGLTINRPDTNNVGLFSYLAEGAMIQDVILMDARVTGDNEVGGLVGYNLGTIQGSSVTGVISGGSRVGGLVGSNQAGGVVIDSFVASTVTGKGENVGGLVGYNQGTILGSSVTGVILGRDRVGGLAGSHQPGGVVIGSFVASTVIGTAGNVGGLVGYNLGTIQGSSVTGVISGMDRVGGLVGSNQAGGVVIGSFVASTVTGKGENVGGLVGYNEWRIVGSSVTGVILGRNNVGGLVGKSFGGLVADSFVASTVTGMGDHVGGLVGFALSSTVSNSCATGSVTGGRDVGGLAGHAAHANISNSSATGSVSGNTFIGGLVGHMVQGATVEDSFATGSVTGTGDNVGGLVGLIEAGPTDISTSKISNSYATGSVMGMGDNVGGLVGFAQSSTVSNSYAMGSVTGMGSDVGGLIGGVIGSTARNSYHVKGPDNGVGAERNFFQMRCATEHGQICAQGGSVSYEGWDPQVWFFGKQHQLPQLKNNHNPDLNNKPYIDGPGERTVRVGTLPGITTLTFIVDGLGLSGRPVTATWSLSGLPVENGLVYYNLDDGTASTVNIVLSDTGVKPVELVVMRSTRLIAGAFFDVVLRNLHSINSDRVWVRIVAAKPPVIAGNSDRRVPESVLSTRLTFTASDTEPGDEANLQWEFLVDGEAMPAIGAVAQFVGPTTGTRVTVELNRPGGKADFGSFMLRVSDPAGASTMVTVNIVPVCAGNGQDLLTRPDGVGTSVDPYQIWTLCQLQDMSSSPSAHYELATSIGAKFATTLNSGDGFNPIASGTENGFSGSFVNNSTHHVITGLTIVRPNMDNVGLFSRLAEGAMIRGVILTDARTTGRNNVGSLVGLSAGNIDNSSAMGLVRGSGDNVGGLVGSSTGSASISNSSATGIVSGNNNVGGLVGENNGGISSSFAAADVSGDRNVGGLAGSSAGGAGIRNSYATGSVSGDKNVGGLVGHSEGSIRNSYAAGSVEGDANIGGLVGSGTNGMRVVASYYTGPENRFGVSRDLEQLQCPVAPGTKCEGAVTYEGWDSRIWDFRGGSRLLPKLKVTPVMGLQGRMRIRVHLGGAAR